MLTLSTEELVALTRRERPKMQARILAALDIPFRVHPTDGTLIVLRAAAEPALGGPAVHETEPDTAVHEASPGAPWGLEFAENWRLHVPKIGDVLRRAGPIEDFEKVAHEDEYVYFILANRVIEYVGRSREVHTRVRAHRFTMEGVDGVAAFPVPVDHVGCVEAFYIRLLDPPRNWKREPGSWITDALLDAAAGRFLWTEREPEFKKFRERCW